MLFSLHINRTSSPKPTQLSKHNPGPAIELVRSHLLSPTLAVLRLVCRAARDDFVDAHCKALRRLHQRARVAALLTAAPRLRCLERFDTSIKRFGNGPDGDAAGVADFLLRLPGRGASLRELHLGFADMLPPKAFDQLRAAAGALAGLRVLRVALSEPTAGGVAGALAAAANGGSSGGRAVALWLDFPAYPPRACGLSRSLAVLLPLGRLERLSLSHGARRLLHQLFEPAVATALTALRALSLTLLDDEAPSPPVWRAPWMARLTRLELDCDCVTARHFSGALLPPGSLPALQELEYDVIDDMIRGDDLAPLLAACDPAALRSLSLRAAHLGDDVARLLEGRWPALRSLQFSQVPELWAEDSADHRGAWDTADGTLAGAAAPAYEALLGARLAAPLTRLALYADGWLFAPGQTRRLAALLTAPWAEELREIELSCVQGDAGDLGRLAALSQLQHLTALHLRPARLPAAALQKVMDDGSAAAWAPRIRELEVSLSDGLDLDDMRALFKMFARLERLCVIASARSRGDAEAAMAEAARALPALKSVEFWVS